MLGKQMTKKLLEILKENKGNIYDFIADNYWQIDKQDLKDLALECVALMYSLMEDYESVVNGQPNDVAVRNAHKKLLENIEEYREDLLGKEED